MNAVKVARGGVLRRPHCERRGLRLRRGKIAAHRHTLRIASLDPIRIRHHAGVVFPTSEHAHLDVWPAHAKGLFARHGVENGSPRIFLGPNAGQSGGAFGARVKKSTDQIAGHARLDCSIRKRMAAEEVVLTIRNGRVMRVRRGAETELVGIEALGVLQGEAILQSLPGVAANDMRNTSGRGPQQHGHEFEAGEFIAR